MPRCDSAAFSFCNIHFAILEIILSGQNFVVPLHRLWRFVSFFSIAFSIHGVKLLLTHLAEIARWVFLYINIKAGNDTRFFD